MPSFDTPLSLKTDLRGPSLAGAVFGTAFGLLLLVLAATITIHGAVIATGKAVVLGKPKDVQHLDGGIVSDILVSDGDRVTAGQVLIRLDDTILKANLEIYQARVANASALRDRLEAERVGASAITFRAIDLAPDDPGLLQARAGQRGIFASRREVREGRKARLEEKILQYNNQIDGINALISAKDEQLRSMDMELVGLIELSEKGFMRRNQVLERRRNRADLNGQLGEHKAELARVENSIRDTEIEIMQLRRELEEEVASDLREVNTSLEELSQQVLSTRIQLKRVDIRAPVDGIVHEMQIATIGGVISPGATVLRIVPTHQGTLFEVHADPTAIDQIYPGQVATLHMSAFSQRSTPDLEGKVVTISPDVVEEESKGIAYYRILVRVPPSEMGRLGDRDVVPGMPVEAFLRTEERTILSFLIKPLEEQMRLAFREE